MKLCIAEKPSVAREIAAVLGARQRHDGYLEGNGYCVSWTFGHLCSLKEPEDYNPAFKKWEINQLPVLPSSFGIKLIKLKGIPKQFNTIKSLIQKCEMVINCGDAGQEGELIQRWVLSLANCKKPVKRLWISSLTEEAIREGFSHLKDGSDFDSLYFAGASRAIGDWILGINATRLFTLKYGAGKGVLSIGRVQTPTLALIVNRHHEIQNFVPQPYWEVSTLYRGVVFTYTKGKFQKQDGASELFLAIENQDLVIESIQTKKGIDHPPKLFDLTSLQVECNKRFGMSADQTLKTAQTLYESKLVSYPRVDTTFLPNDMYPKIKAILSALKNDQDLITPLLSQPIRKSSKVFNDKKVTDHHAIVPTHKVAGNLMGNEAKVYDVIAKRFIAAFYPDCEFLTTTVMAKIAGYDFRVNGKQILKAGWRQVYENDFKTKNNRDEDQILPAFVKGESGPHQPKLDEKMTKPPTEYTEATLLRAMETAGKLTEDEELAEMLKQNGIGRPSTRAAIIETLFRRKYIAKDKRKILPTATGIQLIGVIKNETLKSVELTGAWEKKLRQIENSEYSKDEFIKEMQIMVQGVVESVKNDHSGMKIQLGEYQKPNFKKSKWQRPESSSPPKPESAPRKTIKSKAKPSSPKSNPLDGLLCPKCGSGLMIEGKRAFGCNRYKEGCHFVLSFEIEGKKINPSQVKDLCLKKKTSKLKGFTRAGQKVEGRLVLQQDYSVGLEVIN